VEETVKAKTLLEALLAKLRRGEISEQGVYDLFNGCLFDGKVFVNGMVKAGPAVEDLERFETITVAPAPKPKPVAPKPKPAPKRDLF
jgi:hypothetical protein